MDIRLIHFTNPLSLYGFTFHTTSPDLHFVDSLYLRHLDWPAVLTLTSLYFYTSSKTLSYCLQKDLIISCTWDRKDQDQCSKLAVCRGGFRSVVRWFSLSSCFHIVHLSMYVQETQTLYVSYVSKSDSRPDPQILRVSFILVEVGVGCELQHTHASSANGTLMCVSTASAGCTHSYLILIWWPVPSRLCGCYTIENEEVANR